MEEQGTKSCLILEDHCGGTVPTSPRNCHLRSSPPSNLQMETKDMSIPSPGQAERSLQTRKLCQKGFGLTTRVEGARVS